MINLKLHNHNKYSFFKLILLLFLVSGNCIVAQNPYIKTNSGIGQYGYLEKDATTTMLLNSNTQSNIYQLFARTWLNGNNLFTYGFALNDCTASTNLDQNLNNYNFGANAIAGLIAYTSVHAEYCGGSNSYGGNPNQTGYNERQHYLFDISDRPSDVTSNVIQLNPGAITSPYNVVMSVKIDFGSVSSRVLQRFWIQNTGTLAEASEIANDGFKLYYEPATGSETFNGTESNAFIYGDYNANATNNNIYGHDALNIAIPAGGLRVYVVLNKFAACLSTAKTVQVSLINDGLSFTPAMDTSYTLARVGQTPSAPTTINVSYANATTGALGGTYYIPSACFPTVASAVTALNTFGVSAAVTFNVLAGYTETAPSGGFSLLGSGVAGNLATGTITNTITFQKFGTGTNPTFTASGSNVGGSIMDAAFKIVGGDYITIDGFTMIENPANVLTTAMTEFGVALFYATTTNGAQNNTIKNCTITLNKTNTNTFGIYSNTQHNSTSGTVSVPITNATGSCPNNKFYTNTISNTNIGIAIIGTNTFENTGIDIGGASLATGNTITDQGNAATSGYVGMPGSSTFGIMVSAGTGSNISYNTITGNASAVNSYGIYLRSTSSPATTHTSNILYNTVQVSCSSNNSSYYMAGIYNDMGGTNHTLNINNNTIQNSTTTNATFQGAFYGIFSNAGLPTINVNTNIISNNTITGSGLYNSQTTTNPRSGLIRIANVLSTSISVKDNVMNSNSFTNTGVGDIVALDVSGNYTGTCTIDNNAIDGLSTTGTGSIGGYYTPSTSSASGAVTIKNNTFKNITVSGGGSSSVIQFVRSTASSSQVVIINDNIIDNLTVNTAVNSSGITAIYCSSANSQTIFNNSIKNITSGSTNYGIQTSGGSGPHNVYGNTVNGMTSSVAGGNNHMGIDVSPSSGIANIYNNKVYNISSGTSTNASVYGIRSGGGTTATIYNNMVGDLRMANVSATTFSALRGISIGTPTTANVYNNSVYLNATSTGADFSSAALTFAGTTNTDLRNNILINNSTPNGQGYAAAIMRTAIGTAGTIPPNYLATSNNNCLYAPSVTNGVIYVEGQYTGGTPTNVYTASCFDIAAFKTFVSTRETNSFSEIPPFTSVISGSMDLHIAAAATSGCINGGTTVATASPDIDGNSRPIGSAYEIGADEVAGTNADKIPPVISYTVIPDVGCSSTPVTLSSTITDASVVGSGGTAPRLYFKKLSDATNTIATVNNNTVNGWKYVVATGTYSFTFDYTLLPSGIVPGDTIQYFVAAQDVNGNTATSSATVTPCPTTVVLTSAQTVAAPPTINQFVYRSNLSGNYTIGTGLGQTYPTLSGSGGLFDAINRGYVTGNITATVTSNTVETGVISLNEWTEFDTPTCTLTGTTVYRLTVQSDGTIRTLEGTNLVYNAATLKAMINLNGADRVTFTGGTTTQRNLVFRSTHTTATSCVPVFQMGNGNGSNFITINNCDIQTNGTNTAAPFGTGIFITTVGTNANNLFQLNDIHNAVAGTIGNPRFGVYAENNTATVLQIRDNNFYNIFNKPIQLGVSLIGNGQTVTGNSIYNTGVGSVSNSFTAIELLSATTSGHTITGNYIGGTSALGGAPNTPWTSSTFLNFNGINVTSSAVTQSTISNNFIRNLNCSITTAVTFIGISFTGNILCSGNTIGGSTFGITLNGPTANSNTSNYGIIASPGGTPSTATIDSNSISNITHYTSSASTTRVHAINIFYPTTSTIAVTNNTIDTITSNMKSNLANAYATTSAANVGSNVIGIITITPTSTISINNNTISNLSNTGVNGSLTPSVLGIAIDGTSTNTISRNKIYGLSNQSPGSAANSASIIGIRLFSITGTNTVTNNMITITNGANTNASRIVGVWDNSSSMTMHYNSIVIGGSQSAFGTSGICSAAYACLISATSRSFLNNILINTRTTTSGSPSGSNYHYALAIPTTVTAFTSNYNDLVAADLTKLCLYNTTSYTIAGWQALGTPATPDVNSIAITPTFIDLPNGDLHIKPDFSCTFDNKGIAVATTTDYDLNPRGTPPDIGADEFTSSVSTWNGSAWSTWNGVSFSAAIPTGTTSLLFTGDYSSSANLDGCSCSATGGNIVFNSNHTLTLLDGLIVTLPATFTFENNSSLMQTNNVANTGSITYKRTASSIRGFDYVYWSSPVTGQTIDAIYSIPTPGYKYLWNPTANNINTVSTGTSGIWQTATGAMTPTRGYIVRGSSSFGMVATNITSSFIGVPSNGNQTATISRGNNTIVSQTGANGAMVTNFDDNWNLIGNPYPSSILATEFLKLANNPNIQGFINLWTHGNGPVYSTNPFYNSFASNYTANDYITFNRSGTQSGPSVFNGYIAAGQGFFVSMIDGATGSLPVNFNNSMRDKTYSNTQFYRNTQSIDEHRIWLDLVDSNNESVRTLVGYFPEATLGLDRMYDAFRNIANSKNIYSLAENETLIIQGRPTPFDDNDQVPIGIRIMLAGNYKIAIATVDGLFEHDQPIFLEDKLLNIIYDLRQAPYSFSSSVGIINDRFILRYTNNSLANPDFGNIDNSVIIATNHGELTIKSSIENMQEVTVYDILGRQLFDAKNINNTNFVNSNISMSQQALIVKIKLANGYVVTRKIIL